MILTQLKYKNREKTHKKYSESIDPQANNPTYLKKLKNGLYCPYQCIKFGPKKLFKNEWKWYSHLITHRSVVQEKFETKEYFTLRKENEIKFQRGLAEKVATLIIVGVIPTND